MRQPNLIRSQYRILLVIGFIGLILAGLEGFGIFDSIMGGLRQALVPIQLTSYQVRQNTQNVLGAIGEVGSLRDKNATLSEENSHLLAENARLAELAKENKTLREQLKVQPTKKQNLILAKTIGGSPLASKRLLLINKGKIDGVEEGMVVVVKNILVGKIFDVSLRVSSVQLISDPDTKIPGVTSKGVRGVIVGQFSAEINLVDVVAADKLAVGELVITSGEGDFPEGLVVGKIKEVKRVEKELFQKAVVAPLIEQSDLATVFVVSEK